MVYERLQHGPQILRVTFWSFLSFILVVFLFACFGGVFNETIIPVAFVGCEMIVGTRCYVPGRLSTFSYPARATEIIVNYSVIN